MGRHLKGMIFQNLIIEKKKNIVALFKKNWLIMCAKMIIVGCKPMVKFWRKFCSHQPQIRDLWVEFVLGLNFCNNLGKIHFWMFIAWFWGISILFLELEHDYILHRIFLWTHCISISHSFPQSIKYPEKRVRECFKWDEEWLI